MAGTSIAIGIAAGSAVQSSAASSRARDAECRVILSDFHNITKPALHEQREYAGCVYRLHGDGVPISDGNIMFIKVCIVIVLLSWMYGLYVEFYKNRGSYYNGPLEKFFMSMGYPLFTTLIGIILFMVFGGIMILATW
jgi:hypothetical protein